MPRDKKIIDLAIIIPTLNEEHFVGKLLDSIAKQTILPEEIVVVDAYSKDKTIQEVKKRQNNLPQLRIYQIPRYTISRQRNLGVTKTKSWHILFLDADMELKEEDTLEKYVIEVLRKKLSLATAVNLPNSNYWKDKIYFQVENLSFKIFRFFWPVVSARNLYIHRKTFDLVGGFDEDLAVGEDQELVHRVVKKGGKMIFLKDATLYTSTRRLEKEGRKRYALKMILFGFKVLFKGHRKSKVKYEFGNFKQSA